MFDDEKHVIAAARRWYSAVKRNRDPLLTDALALKLASAVVAFERGRGLKHLTAKWQKVTPQTGTGESR